VQWIISQLEPREVSRRRLIEAIKGMTESKMSLVLNGHRKLTSDEADQIRHFFGYRLPDDPPSSKLDELRDKLAELEEHQITAVALFVDALTSASQSN
jgi:hypothetical protein